jgi:hypothetical protein
MNNQPPWMRRTLLNDPTLNAFRTTFNATLEAA